MGETTVDNLEVFDLKERVQIKDTGRLKLYLLYPRANLQISF